MTRRSLRVAVAALLAFLGTHPAAADDLANQSFKIVYDAQGIRSLKRTIAYGGVLSREGLSIRVVPRDGLRVRFHVVRDEQRLHLVLDHDGFAKEQPVTVADDLSRVQFVVENRSGGAHATGLSVAGLPAGDYAVTVDGRHITTISGGSPTATAVSLPIGATPGVRVVVARTAR